MHCCPLLQQAPPGSLCSRRRVVTAEGAVTPSLVSASIQKARQASFCLSAIPPLSPSGLSLPVPIPSRLDSDPSSLAPTVFLGGLTCSKFHPPPWRARLPHLHRPLSPLSSRSAKATFLHSSQLAALQAPPSHHIHSCSPFPSGTLWLS